MRPEDTGTGRGARQHGEGCLAADPPGVRPRQQDLGGGQRAQAGFSGDQPRGHLLDDLGDLRLQIGRGLGEGGDPLAEPGQGLVQDPGLPVGGGRAGQRGALGCPALAWQVAQPLAQRRGRGDQDRGQRGAGGLGGLDGVVPADHEQPQRFAVAVGSHLRRPGPGEQLSGRPDCVDRITLAATAPAHVPAAVNLGDVLARAG